MSPIKYFEKRKQKKEEKAERKSQQSKLKRVLKTIAGTVLYILIIVGLIWGAPKALSYYLDTEYPMAAFTSGSMWPILKRGDLIFVEGVGNAKENVRVNDIVVFMNIKNAFTIHRIIELKDDTLITKGDANNVSDEPVKYEDIIGRLYKIGNWNARIPKLGFISTSISKFVQK